jgi:MFS family permease
MLKQEAQELKPAKVVNSNFMASTMIHRKAAFAVILTVQLMLQMDFLIVIVSLKNIQQDLGFTAAGLSWVPNAFALTFGGLLLLGGRLGDIIGQVKAFQIGLAIFVVASLAGGIAPTAPVLIAARVFQGIGAALAAPSVLALITILARDEAEKNRGLSLFIAVSSMGASAGLILGGALTQFISWRWSLLINVPIGAMALFAIGFLVPETGKASGKVDYMGALTGTLASTALVYGFMSAVENGWSSLMTTGSFTAAPLMFWVFFWIESKVAQPLLRPGIFRTRSQQAGLIVMAIIVGMHFATLFLILQYFQQVLGLNPLLAGIAYLPLTAIVFTVTQFIPRLVARFGLRNLLIMGGELVAISLLGFAQLDETSSYLGGVLLPLALHSVGIAFVFTPGSILILDGVAGNNAGIGSGVLQMDQQIGGAVGIASIVTIYAANVQADIFYSGLDIAFEAAAIFSLIAAIVAGLMIPARKNTKR